MAALHATDSRKTRNAEWKGFQINLNDIFMTSKSRQTACLFLKTKCRIGRIIAVIAVTKKNALLSCV